MEATQRVVCETAEVQHNVQASEDYHLGSIPLAKTFYRIMTPMSIRK